jgi:hypothetical protein
MEVPSRRRDAVLAQPLYNRSPTKQDAATHPDDSGQLERGQLVVDDLARRSEQVRQILCGQQFGKFSELQHRAASTVAGSGFVSFAGHEDGPVMHTGDADPGEIHATGIVGFVSRSGQRTTGG